MTSGEYVIYDGQACGDGTTECSAAWIFANGTNVGTTITIYGNGAGGRSATPSYPGGYARVCSTSATCSPTALQSTGCHVRSDEGQRVQQGLEVRGVATLVDGHRPTSIPA